MSQTNNGLPVDGKLHGVYPQKQTGLFMQRVKVPGGRISLHQWRAVAGLAATYTPGTPLHLTTRQDIEFHNVSANDLAAIQKALAAGGMSTLGTGGDSVRNITVCTGCRPASNIDVYELARTVKDRLESESANLHLPRKFKISFSGCPKACAKPFINDLGFILQDNGAFTVIGAGSLGHRPALGIELYKDVLPCDIRPLCEAAVEYFAEYGDRENRRRARFRHVRERLGDEPFKQELEGRFETKRSKNKDEKASDCHQRNDRSIPTHQNSERSVRLQLPNGDILPEDALLVADFAEPLDLELRINLSHGLELFASASCGDNPLPAMPPSLERLAAAPTVVACPGCSTCPNALTDCRTMAEDLRKDWPLAPDDAIHISGCPNDCAQCAVAGIGLVGLVRTVDSSRKQCYRVLTGGDGGRTAALATETAVLPEESVPQYIKALAAGPRGEHV